MVAHRFAIPPRMDFRTKGLGLGEAGLADARIHGSLSQSQPDIPPAGGTNGWFGFWESRDDPSDFIVRESSHAVAHVGNGDDNDALPYLA